MKQDAEKFLKGWGGPEVAKRWAMLLRRHSLTVDTIFTERRLRVPGYVPENHEAWHDTPAELYWLEPDKHHKMHLVRQCVYDDHTDGLEPLSMLAYGAGPELTLKLLWKYRYDQEKVAGILLSAALFPLLHSSRSRHYAGIWPAHEILSRIDHWAASWRAAGDPVWHYSCTEVLVGEPQCGKKEMCHLDTMEQLLYFLAQRVAVALLAYRPLALLFCAEGDPDLDLLIKARSGAAESAAMEWQEAKKRAEAEQAMQEAKDRIEIELLKEQHPRFGTWQSVTAEELTSLVWSMPAVELAKQFGVSDVAIGKKCKALGVRKPPQGFWNMVQAGKIPHPGGMPKQLFGARPRRQRKARP